MRVRELTAKLLQHMELYSQGLDDEVVLVVPNIPSMIGERYRSFVSDSASIYKSDAPSMRRFA